MENRFGDPATDVIINPARACELYITCSSHYEKTTTLNRISKNLTEETAQIMIGLLERLSQDLKEHPSVEVYDNQGLKELLGIGDKYLKNLRDNGHIGYSRYGDKYWYTRADVEGFLHSCHYEAFATKGGAQW